MESLDSRLSIIPATPWIPFNPWFPGILWSPWIPWNPWIVWFPWHPWLPSIPSDPFHGIHFQHLYAIICFIRAVPEARPRVVPTSSSMVNTIMTLSLLRLTCRSSRTAYGGSFSCGYEVDWISEWGMRVIVIDPTGHPSHLEDELLVLKRVCINTYLY